MIRIPSGKVLAVRDCGSIWQLFYELDGNGLGVVNFDHRPFAHFYEGVTGRDFFRDYAFGAGRDYVSQQLKDLRIVVEGEPFSQTVKLEED
ncbi:MAG: hypothetical protein L0338_36780 [Acidobacteria bacterium]|nr:hypothetical protein [Acidobacteriota bacterium]